jgi:hypothetical protein
MGMLVLVAGDQTFEVEQLTDVDPAWQGVKVMTPSADLTVVVGTEVRLQSENSGLAGTYTVTQRLTPAAPRGWRLFLDRVAAASAPAAAPTVASQPAIRVDPTFNTSKTFTLKVSGMGGMKVRQSVTEVKVSFDRLSLEVQRITKAGGKILSITESGIL